MKPVSVGERIYSYARNGDIAGLNSFDQKALVENANWRHPRNYKQTPLYTACKYGKLTAVNLLLKHGADPQLCDEFGVSSFDVACIEGRTLVVQALLAVKSSLALSPSSVVLACQEGRCSILKLLFACGASPELPLGEFTPLMAAALSNRVDVIDILMKADVSLEVKFCFRFA
jgi:ankyrin repeat protein